MKKILCFLLLLFLFFQKINAQNEPRLVKELVQHFNDSLGIFIDRSQTLYEFDSRELLTEKITDLFELNGNLESQSRIKYEYDTDDLLIKEIHQNRNLSLQIWTTSFFNDFFYDEKNCVNESHFIPNVISQPNRINIITNDEECRPIQEDISVYFLDSLVQQWKILNQFEEDRIIKYSLHYFYNPDSSHIYRSSEQNWFYDENNEIEKRISYGIQYPQNDTVSTQEILYEVESEFYPDNGLLKSKKITEYYLIERYNEPTLDTVLFLERENHYKYCNGLLAQENQIANYVITAFDDNSITQRIFYFYENETQCFDTEENFTAKIFPNPNNGIFQIQSPFLSSGKAKIRVVDILGNIKFKKTIDSADETITLDVSALNNGIYLVQLLVGKNFFSEKIIIAK